MLHSVMPLFKDRIICWSFKVFCAYGIRGFDLKTFAKLSIVRIRLVWHKFSFERCFIVSAKVWFKN